MLRSVELSNEIPELGRAEKKKTICKKARNLLSKASSWLSHLYNLARQA